MKKKRMRGNAGWNSGFSSIPEPRRQVVAMQMPGFFIIWIFFDNKVYYADVISV